MHLRTITLACALLATTAALHGSAAPPPAARSAPVAVRSSHEQPLPFLGSGGVVMQVAVPHSAPLPAIRAGAAHRLAPVALRRARVRDLGALYRCDHEARIRACLLGTPPPAPHPGRTAGPCQSVAA